jgi:hypothetical protein
MPVPGLDPGIVPGIHVFLSVIATGRGKPQVQPCPQCPECDGRPSKWRPSRWANSRRERRSLHLDARGLNDRPPFSDLGPVVGAKRLGRLLCARGYLLAEIGKALP